MSKSTPPPVTDSNPPRPPRPARVARPAPPPDTPAPVAPAPVAPAPDTPAPVAPAPVAPAPVAPAPVAPAPAAEPTVDELVRADVARFAPEPGDDEVFARTVAAHDARAAGAVVVGDGLLDQVPAPDAAALLGGLARMRRKRVNPMTDYAPDGTRQLRVVQAVVSHVAALTGRRQQEVYRDAVLGIAPLPRDLLDAHYLDLYGADEYERRPWGPNPREID